MNAPPNGRPLDGQLAFFDTPAAQRGRYVPTYAGDFSATHARLGEDGLNVSVYLDLLGVGEFVPRSVEHLQQRLGKPRLGGSPVVRRKLPRQPKAKGAVGQQKSAAPLTGISTSR